MSAWKEDDEASSWWEVRMGGGCASGDWIATERAVERKEERGTADTFGVLNFFHNCSCPCQLFHLTGLVAGEEGLTLLNNAASFPALDNRRPPPTPAKGWGTIHQFLSSCS